MSMSGEGKVSIWVKMPILQLAGGKSGGKADMRCLRDEGAKASMEGEEEEVPSQ